ncbi:MAG TPA: 4-hydroxythreonine-4-phosphate dehydrogenase PdxA [Geothrix sp.]|nr:4-hydroxythreonine-4-phosphate dehydrogenase PdxA [Geothrix sp.]
MSRRPRIVISLGDPCGIGPELLIKSLPVIQSWTDVTIVGSRAGVELLDGLPGAPLTWDWADAPAPGMTEFKGHAYGFRVLSGPPHPGQGLADAQWLDPTPEITTEHLKLGEGSAPSGRATVEAIRCAAGMVMRGEADALVTLPMAKAAAHLAGYDIPGHTEFLQQLSGCPRVRMAFVSPRLNVVLHTVHQSLRSVLETLDADAVAETLSFATDRFIQLLGNPNLQVALCALNPHAGERGAFGEEEQILTEALKLAEADFMDFHQTGAGPFAEQPSPFPPGPAPEGWRVFPGRPILKPRMFGHQGLECLTPRPLTTEVRSAPCFFGPLPADTVFHRASQGEFDLVVALYHDQGLIPIKVMEPTEAVNLTLGLPFIRTSPDHGTAFDKAGHWIGDPRNFQEAAALAVRLAGRARNHPWVARTPHDPE